MSSSGASTPARLAQKRRWIVSDEQGFAAGAEALIFGVLVFVLGTIIILNAWSVVDAKFATSAAAREAVRAVAEAEVGADLQATAGQAADQAFRGHGREPEDVTVVWDGEGLGVVQARCAEVRYRASSTVGVMAIPRFANQVSFTVTSVYSELIDPFRSGLQESVCEL